MAGEYRQLQYPSGNSFVDSLASLTQYNQANKMYNDTRGDKYLADTERYAQKTQAVNISMLSQRALVNQQDEVERFKTDYLNTIREVAANAAEAKENELNTLIDTLKSYMPKGNNNPNVPKSNANTVVKGSYNPYLDPNKATPYNSIANIFANDYVNQEQYRRNVGNFNFPKAIGVVKEFDPRSGQVNPNSLIGGLEATGALWTDNVINALNTMDKYQSKSPQVRQPW